MDFSDSDETGTDSHTALKIFACNFFKARSSFLFYVSYCGLTGRTSCFVNVSDKVWRVSACTACPSAEELPKKQHALEVGQKKTSKSDGLKIMFYVLRQQMQGKVAVFSRLLPCTSYSTSCLPRALWVRSAVSPVAEQGSLSRSSVPASSDRIILLS